MAILISELVTQFLINTSLSDTVIQTKLQWQINNFNAWLIHRFEQYTNMTLHGTRFLPFTAVQEKATTSLKNNGTSFQAPKPIQIFTGS